MFLEHKSPWDCSKQVHKKECLPLSVMFSSRSDPDLKKIFHHLLKILKTFSQPLSKTELYKTLTLVKGVSVSPVFLGLRWAEHIGSSVAPAVPVNQQLRVIADRHWQTDVTCWGRKHTPHTHTHTPWNIDYLSLNEPRLTTLTDTTLAPWRTKRILEGKRRTINDDKVVIFSSCLSATSSSHVYLQVEILTEQYTAETLTHSL